jgi:predicted metalloprotease
MSWQFAVSSAATVDVPRRTRHNEVVTLGSENDDQASPRLGQESPIRPAGWKGRSGGTRSGAEMGPVSMKESSSSTERVAWEALKKFVDPPLGSHSGLPVGKESAGEARSEAEMGPVRSNMGSFGPPRAPDPAPQSFESAARPGDEVGPEVSNIEVTQPVGTAGVLRPGEQVPLGRATEAEISARRSVGIPPASSSRQTPLNTPPNTPLPVKPVWPESIPTVQDARRKKRRRWPILGLAGLLIAGAVVALAKPSILPASVRRTLHVGESTNQNEAAKTNKTNRTNKGDNDKSGSEAATSTVPTTRPKRTVQGYDPTMRQALTSIDRYWAKQFPEVYDDTYEKLSGGVYAYSAGSRIPSCDGQSLPYLVLQQNAFYCPESDFIAWDDQGLFPRLEKKYGRFLLAIVLAHEWGHAIQERSGSYLDTITAEQQADCFAGAWAASLDPKTDQELAKLRDAELDKALSGFIEFRDLVGMVASDPGAHGTAFDRIRAFQDGFEGTPSSCAYYEEELPDLVAIPYRSFKERFRGGNLPYPEVLPSITKELANNWKSVFSTAPVTTSAAKVFPVCFAQPVSPEGFSDSTLSYCDDDKTLRYDEKNMRTLYDRIGDFGPATTIGVGWAMSDLVAEGKDPNTKPFWSEANCRVGAWAGTMFDASDPENSQLSPGDLDESVRTILESSAKGASSIYGTGFEQVSAFRAGVLNGVSACASIASAN